MSNEEVKFETTTILRDGTRVKDKEFEEFCAKIVERWSNDQLIEFAETQMQLFYQANPDQYREDRENPDYPVITLDKPEE